MARGWESKSVESQIEDGRAPGTGRRDNRSRDDIERQRARDSLELSRRRVLHELTETHSDLRRLTLQRALEHLDGELQKLR